MRVAIAPRVSSRTPVAQGGRYQCPSWILRFDRNDGQHNVRRGTVQVLAAQGSSARQAVSDIASAVYKMTAFLQQTDPSLSLLWQSILKLDLNGVTNTISKGGDVNERNAAGDTPLLYIARQGHYKFPPAQIPLALVKAGADLEAKDSSNLTALQVSLLSGWQNIAELLIKNGADTAGVASIKGRVTCPDCKRVIQQYQL